MTETSTENAEALEAFDKIVVTATEGLFDAYELSLTGSKRSEADWDVQDSNSASVIGFTSPHFSGSVVIGTSIDIIEHTAPDAETSLPDWMGELANQLLGRIKNKLLKHDIALDMAIPVVVMGVQLRTPKIEGRTVLDYRFDSDRGLVVVRVDLAPDWVLGAAQEDSDGDTGEEGDLLLF